MYIILCDISYVWLECTQRKNLEINKLFYFSQNKYAKLAIAF